MRIMPPDAGIIHMIGIGGIGMSGIAEILHDLGYEVQGSDLADGANVQRLRAKGIRVMLGHETAHLRGAAVAVRSSAVRDDNPELVAARDMRLPVVRRAEMLAELMRLKNAVVIGGTHGKTTTTSLVGAMLESGGFDPTVINGGVVNQYGTNTRLGGGDWMAVEADESDGTFTRLPATVAVVTNIDPEHMEAYGGTFENVRKAYRRFVENLPFYGYAVLCTDHPEVMALLPHVQDKRVITYGTNAQADVQALRMTSRGGHSHFDVKISGWVTGGNDLLLPDMVMPMPGQHNVLNALAALAVGAKMGMRPAAMKQALRGFGGVKRRFTQTGVVNGVTVIDDYGHHPVEITAVLKAARECVVETGGRVLAVMQPHRYSRLHDLFDEFATCFGDADKVWIADVYAAGETPIEGADKTHLVDAIAKHGHRHAAALESPSRLAHEIAVHACPGDYVICLGAGDITKWAHDLPAALAEIDEEERNDRSSGTAA